MTGDFHVNSREPRFSNFIVGGIIFRNISWMLIDSVVLHQRYSIMAAFYGRAYAFTNDGIWITILYGTYIHTSAHGGKRIGTHNGAISGTCSSKKLFRVRRSDGASSE